MYKIKTDLLGHADEVYCLDFVANKVVSGGWVRTVQMCADEFSHVDGRIEGLHPIDLDVYLVPHWVMP